VPKDISKLIEILGAKETHFRKKIIPKLNLDDKGK
jgi:hypothetical protein